jgi:hypothetical protein
MLRPLTLSLLVLIAFKTYAQSADSARGSDIKWNPRIGEWASFLYEKQYAKQRSIEFGAGYIDHIYMTGEKGLLVGVKGFALRTNFNRYRTPSALSGFYTGPMLLYRFVQIPEAVYDSVAHADKKKDLGMHVIEIGFRAGNQYIVGRHFSIGIYMGLGIRFKYVPDNIDIGKNEEYLVGYPIARGSESAFLFCPAVHFGLNAGWIFGK